MTITTAFKELISDNSEWYRTTNLSRVEAESLQHTFIDKGFQRDAVKKILISAGYILTETWSKPKNDLSSEIAITKFIHHENKILVKTGASKSEIDLIRQANNPLGDPNKM